MAAESIREPAWHRPATRSRSRDARAAFVVAVTSPRATRSSWTPRARSTRARTALRSPRPLAGAWSAATSTGGSTTWTSIRSRRGPLILASVRAHPLGRARAPAAPVAQPPAEARVHRADEEKARRERGLAVGARDGHDPVFERLTERFERRAAELCELVEKEHAVVGEADLAGPRPVAAADETDLADRVVGRAERPDAREAQGRLQEAGDAVNRRDLERLLRRERGAGGRGGRRASIVLPAPGGPIMARLCAPAAAISERPTRREC